MNKDKIKNTLTEIVGIIIIGALLGVAAAAAWAYEDRVTTEPQSVIRARENVRALMEADVHP